jgi:hypothetical protein
VLYCIEDWCRYLLATECHRLENPFIPERGLAVRVLVLLRCFRLFVSARTWFSFIMLACRRYRSCPPLDNVKVACVWGSVLQSSTTCQRLPHDGKNKLNRTKGFRFDVHAAS